MTRWLNRAIAAAILCILATGCSSPNPQRGKESTTPPKAETPTYFRVDPGTAGTASGKIAFTGRKPARVALRIDEDPVCVRLNKGGLFDESVVVNANGTLANVFVYVKEGLGGKAFEPAGEPLVIDQKGCRFAPRMLGVRVGQMLRVTNSDPLTHNIHPMPQNSREWNQSQPEGAAPLERKFVRPEMMVRVKCNVHSWMRAYINVMEHPYFAVSGKDGAFEIPNLPPGEYMLEALHETLGAQQQRILVPASGRADVAFTFKGI